METETTPTQSYSEQWYWDERYTNESDPFDWYQSYTSLSPLINLYAPNRPHPVLVIGCGNSAFSEGMVDDGYEDVISIDISSVVIDAMVKKYSDRPRLKCKRLCLLSKFCGRMFFFFFCLLCVCGKKKQI